MKKRKTMKIFTFIIFCAFGILNLYATEYHVSVSGNDSNPGTLSKPFKTISEAVKHAFPGDTITVHKGTYREWIDPLRGGKDDATRILYRAAPNEKVEIKGSEIITGWKKEKKGIWKVTLPNSFFGDYNPFQDSVFGDWFHRLGRVHHTGDVFINGKSLYEVETLEKVHNPVVDNNKLDPEGQKYTWYCQSNDKETVIWANFHKYNPNRELTEVSSRKTCFYPSKQGINYITIRGFDISQAATQWAAPTAEQVGMIATHWNKGWIIENNVIHDSRCNGITLGKERGTGHNVWSADEDNINRDGNIHYIEVVFRVLRNNWDKQHIGSHIVRNNTIYNCEQAGLCGSMGAVFSTIENNHIYNINKKEQFKGWEIGGIKIHAPVDVTIKGNRVHNCERGIWLDWMTQGARVTENVLYRNRAQDLFIEVNHGPYIVDNNILLSKVAVSNWSQGGAYIHNLIMGEIQVVPVLDRFTPYFMPHSIKVAGLSTISGGDDRYFNNIIGASAEIKKGEHNWMLKYDSTKYVNSFEGNVFINNVNAPEISSKKDAVLDGFIEFAFIEKEDELQLNIDLGKIWQTKKQELITSEILGRTKLSKAAFDGPDGGNIIFDTDCLGEKRLKNNINAGPFSTSGVKDNIVTIWERR